jgi:hypothetical protein
MTSRRYTDAVLASLAARLTRRDRYILRMVWENRVLTSPQVAELAFDSDDTARKRLLRLHDFGVLDRFQPNLPVGAGTAPFHYVIGEAGAAVLACEDGIEFADFGYRRDRVLAIAYSQKLAHTVGVNGFFTALVAYARRQGGARLLTWWPEHRCAKVWGEAARPDAYGNWSEDRGGIEFFLEYDTGTETLDRVANKLHGYAKLTKATGITTPVLFYVHSARREANLRHRLINHPAASLVPVATGCRSALITPDDHGPAGRIWHPLDGRPSRYRLATIGAAWPQLIPAAPPRPGLPDRSAVEAEP